jgi:hypothetical protein
MTEMVLRMLPVALHPQLRQWGNLGERVHQIAPGKFSPGQYPQYNPSGADLPPSGLDLELSEVRAPIIIVPFSPFRKATTR